MLLATFAFSCFGLDAIFLPLSLVKYKINNIVTYNFYDSNLNNINGFLPSEGSTYYMALSSAKKYGI